MSHRVLITGHREIGAGTRAWVESEIRKLFKKLLKTKDVYIYSGLSQGVEITCAKQAIEVGIPVLGCIPYEDFNYKFPSYDMQMYREVIPKLEFLKIVDKKGSYECYRKRTLYLVHQSSSLAGFWDKKEEYTGSYFSLFLRTWKGRGYEVYHYNPISKTSISSVS